MNLIPIFLSVVTFFSTLVGGLLAARQRKNIGLLSAFASGVLISVALLDLLPETLKIAVTLGVSFETIMQITAVGFIFLLVLERYFSVHHVCEGKVCKNIRHPRGRLFGAAELSIHSFMDGFAIGLAFHFSFNIGVIVAFAVIAHDFSDGLNTVTVMLKSGNSLRSSLRLLLVDAVAPVLGVLSTYVITLPETALVMLLPFFAGGFLYLGASDLLPEAHEKSPPLITVAVTIAGFLLIFAVVSILNV
jgi:ZIP family zinc transporter